MDVPTEQHDRMDVMLFRPRTPKRVETCCVTDAEGRHWCFKAIKNIKLNGYAKCFVCSGPLCNVKVYYTSHDEFRVVGSHVCAFDHEREYRKRTKCNIAVDAMLDNVLLKTRDIISAVKSKTELSRREEKTLAQFVSSQRLSRYGKVPRQFADLVIPECLKVVGTIDDDGDGKFLIFDSFDTDKDKERILIFSSSGMRQRASAAVEIFADGTYRTASNTIATLYTMHTVIDGISFPIFFVMMPNELERTFVRAFEVVKPLMGSFNETCTAHVDCQLAAVNAIRTVFGCSIRICLFHLNQAVWRSVSRFGLAGYYNNTRFPKLHVWIRRLFALPFLPEDAIHSNFDVLFEHDAIHGPIHVEDECLDAFKKHVRYYKSFWLARVPLKMWCNNTTRERTNNRCEGFHNGLRKQSILLIQILLF